MQLFAFSLTVFVLLSNEFRVINAVLRFKRADNNHTYTTKYDNIDYKKIVESKRLMISYVNCLLDKGPCTPEGVELKRNLPEALQTECQYCSKAQKTIFGVVLGYLVERYRDLFDLLVAKYDPDGNFMAKYNGDDNTDYDDY